MKRIELSKLLPLFCGGLLSIAALKAEDNVEKDLFDMSFEELMKIKVSTPAKVSQAVEKSPSLVTVITDREIRHYGANSLFEILERVTSVYMTGSFFFQQNVAAVRGDLQSHADNHVLILINGRPFRESYSGGVNFPIYNAFPIELIERIEIIRGPGSVLYGTNAVSGVFNIITRQAEQNASYVRLQSGSDGALQWRFLQQHKLENGELNAAIQFSEQDGWLLAAKDSNSNDGELAMQRQDLGMWLDYRESDWHWQNLYLNSENAFMGASTNWSGMPALEDRQMQADRFLSNWGRRWQTSELNTLLFEVSYSTLNFDHYNYQTHARDWFIELANEYDFNSHINWISGINLWRQKVSSEPGLSSAPIRNFSSVWYEAYSQLVMDLSEPIQLTVGVQANKAEHVPLQLTPRASINLQFSEHWTINASFAKAFRAAFGVETNFDLILRNPDGSIRGGLRGNPGLEPEIVETYELALRYQNEQHALEMVYFDSRMHNLIGRERAADNVLDFVNEGRLETDGFELEYKGRLNEQWAINASFSQQNNRSDKGVEGFTLVPKTLFKTGVSYNSADRRWSFGLFDQYVSAAPLTSLRNPAVIEANPVAESYHLASLNIRWRWLLDESSGIKNASTQLSIYNLLDQDIYHPEFSGRQINTLPARAPRCLYLGVTLQF